MTTWMRAAGTTEDAEEPIEPAVSARSVLVVLALSLVFVVLTRLPVARTGPIETDEHGFLAVTRDHWLPMHHTLFLASGKALGVLLDDPYRGFIALDMIVSALGLTSTWWWLRAIVRPSKAAATTLLLAVAPVFWSYGAMAATYPGIIATGSFLLGIVARRRLAPRAWHPYAATLVFAWGTAYRQDIGTLWLPVFFLILWTYRWRTAFRCVALFTALNVLWLLGMLYDVGGWTRYRAASAEFAHNAGWLNSVFTLGVVDAPVRYSLKLAMALLWTLGPGLLATPRGLVRLARRADDRILLIALVLSMLPALGGHLLVHFGVAGYAFHYVPALLGLLAIGISRVPHGASSRRLLGVAAVLAALFLFYPTDFNRPGLRGDFDLAFARFTRIGLQTCPPTRAPETWRTANSRRVNGLPGSRMEMRSN